MKTIKILFFLIFIVLAALLLSPYYIQFLKSFPKIQSYVQQAHDLVTKNLARIPIGLGDMRLVTWSPDGQKLVAAGSRFTLSGTKVWSLYDMDLAEHKAKRIGSYSGRDEIK